MRRKEIYLIVALLTFGISTLIVYKMVSHSVDDSRTSKHFGATKTSSFGFPQADSTSKEKMQLTHESEKDVAKNELFCFDKRIKPVWNLLLKEMYSDVPEDYQFDVPDCSDMFEVMFYDLNQDGKNEILLRGKITDFCGGVGNCRFWVFEKKDGKYRTLLSTSDYVDITKMGRQIQQEKTNGYLNLLIKGHMNAADTNYIIYEFDGRKYNEGKGLVHTYDRSKGYDNPHWEFISEEEYARREGY